MVAGNYKVVDDADFLLVFIVYGLAQDLLLHAPTMHHGVHFFFVDSYAGTPQLAPRRPPRQSRSAPQILSLRNRLDALSVISRPRRCGILMLTCRRSELR